MKVRDLVPPETGMCLFPNVLQKKSGFREAELAKKVGSRFLADIKGFLLDLNGLLLVVGIVSDITEKRQR